jgi:hypothetical protein
MSYQRKAGAPFFIELLVSVIHVSTTNTESMITHKEIATRKLEVLFSL